MKEQEPTNTVEARGQTYREDNAGPLIGYIRTHALGMLTSPDRDELFVAVNEDLGLCLNDQLQEGLR